MANKNTKRARKQGLSNWPATCVGTGEANKEVVERNAQDNSEFKGTCVNTAWDAPNSNRKSPRKYPEMKQDAHDRYKALCAKFQGE